MTTIIAVVAFLVAQTSGPVSPFEGHWKTTLPPSIERSSFGMAPSGMSFAVTRDTVKITEHWIYFRLRITALNAARQQEQVYQTDGKPHQAPNDPTGSTTVAKWLSPHVLEIIYNQNRPDGIYTTLVTYTIAADQKTLTERRSDLPSNSEKAYYR